MNMKPIIIYHANCADGFSGAWCFWRKYGHDADYVAASYAENAPDVTGRDVYLVDFSYKRDVVAAMIRIAASVTLIDHHKSAIDDLAELQGLATYTDLERSGATLAWDFLFPHEPRPLLLGHVEDRDLWRFRLAGTREIQAFVFSLDYTFEQWDRLMSADQVELLKMSAAGAAIERKHRKDVSEIVRASQRRMVIAGYDVPAANVPFTMASDAGAMMADGEPFAACYYDTDSGRKFSLRSSEAGVDVATIAELFGGGGHKHAAGFKVPFGHVLTEIDDSGLQLMCARTQVALTALGAALASFPKSASEACIEQAVRILQGRYAVGGIVAGESPDQVPSVLAERSEYFVDEAKAARTGVYQYRDTGSLETGEDHERQ